MQQIFVSWLTNKCIHKNILIIMIITLFQKDNIFGTSASLIYGPQLQLQILPFLIGKCKLFTLCTEQLRSPYIEHAASRLHNLTQGEV